jgi:cytoskeleton protein RodZ
MAEDNRQPAAAAGAPPEKRSVGETLKDARNAQDLTLEQVATELRIELPQLEALEADRFERIGVPVFVKGYLRQYALRLGLDPRALLACYSEQTKLKEVLVQPSKTIKLRDERQITVWVIAALAILVVIVGLAAWWVGTGGPPVASGPSVGPNTSGDAKPASVAPAAAPEPASVPASGSSAPAAEPAPSPSPSTPAATPAPSGAGAPAPTPSGGAGTASTTTLAVATPPPSPRASAERPAPASSPPAAAPNEKAASPPAAAAAADSTSDDAPGASLIVPLDLTFDQESWAEVTDAKGERLYYGLGTAGKHAQMRGEPPFAVVLGNATGVKIVVDGEDFAIPAKGKPGEYARFSVNVVSD